jgi:macrolide-specific efflux system membrane fusion protein
VKLKVTIAILLLFAVGAGAFWATRGGRKHDVKYQEVEVERDDLRASVLSTGVVQPENRLDVKPPLAGRVEQLLVVEGQRVKRGQILAWMSSTERAALLDAAQAKGPDELKYWEEAYKATPLLAPVNGVIILKNIERGQTVTATDPILTMSDRLIVKAQVDETDLAEVKLGQPVDIALDAYPKDALKGKVLRIAFDSKTVNNVTTYEVHILPESVPAFMKSGMTTNVSFLISEKSNVLVVPAAAVRRDGGRSKVLVPGEGKEGSRPVEVKVGITDGKRVEIVEGLKEGDKVMVPKVSGLSKREGGNNPFSPLGGGGHGGGGRR